SVSIGYFDASNQFLLPVNEALNISSSAYALRLSTLWLKLNMMVMLLPPSLRYSRLEAIAKPMLVEDELKIGLFRSPNGYQELSGLVIFPPAPSAEFATDEANNILVPPAGTLLPPGLLFFSRSSDCRFCTVAWLSTMSSVSA